MFGKGYRRSKFRRYPLAIWGRRRERVRAFGRAREDLRCLSGQINLLVVGVWLREGTIWIRVDLLHVEPAVGFIAPIQKRIRLPDGGKLVVAHPFSAKSSGIYAGDGERDVVETRCLRNILNAGYCH